MGLEPFTSGTEPSKTQASARARNKVKKIFMKKSLFIFKSRQSSMITKKEFYVSVNLRLNTTQCNVQQRSTHIEITVHITKYKNTRVKSISYMMGSNVKQMSEEPTILFIGVRYDEQS